MTLCMIYDKSDMKLRGKIRNYYLEILEREPNPSALEFFVDKISKNEIELERLPIILKNSREYKNLELFQHGCIYTKFGFKMYLNKDDSIVSKNIARNYVWEKDESDYMISTITNGMNVIDMGAHIGYFTVLLSRLVGCEGKVYSFEPSKENFELLERNLLANQCNNVISSQKAVSNSNEQKFLFLSESNKGDHRIIDFHVFPNDNHRNKISVDCVTLDSLIPENIQIDFIKMDIQGSEMLALEGMKETVNRCTKLKILTEFWPYGIEKSGYEAKEFIEMIIQLGFKIFVFEKGCKNSINQNYKLILNHSKVSYVNLICEKIS